MKFSVGAVPALLLALVSSFLSPDSASAQSRPVAPVPAAASSSLWKDVNEASMVAAMPAARVGKARRDIVPLLYRTVNLDRPAMAALLKAAPPEFVAPMRTAGIEVSLPLPYGGFGRFLALESSIMEPALARKYPELKTYSLQGIDDPAATGRADLTPRGFHALILSPRGEFYVDPYWSDDDTVHISYYKRNFVSRGKAAAYRCQVDSSATDFAGVIDRLPSPKRPTGAMLRVFRMAVACTPEYAAGISGTSPGTLLPALAAMVTTMNRISAIYERDFAIRFVLVANTDTLVFLDPATSPYTADNNMDGKLLDQNQAVTDARIGNANYDIGHLLTADGAGGVAQKGICVTGFKARGESGQIGLAGDPHDVDFVSHEIGHQFGASHIFNATGDCGPNRSTETPYEPGSGSTIMSYAGVCGNSLGGQNHPQDIARHNDDYFNSASYDQVDSYTTVETGTCAMMIATGNTPPAIAALTNYTIPAQTPFALTANATDPDGDTLTYCWEQHDLGPAQDPTLDPRDNGMSPLFRSFDPSPSPTRIFPSITYILNNANVPPPYIPSSDGDASHILGTGEFLPTTTRTMNFRVTVRDNRAGGGGSNYNSMTVTSVATGEGPFAITSQNTSATIAAGSVQSVTWNVAGTTANGINCANVKISLSTDGGYTFPFVLAASTPNNGLAGVTIPNIANVATTQGRLKVEAIGNIFFDISDANLTITSTQAAPDLAVTSGLTVVRGTPTATFGMVATSAAAVSATVSNLPGDVSVTPSVSAGSIGLSVIANCTIALYEAGTRDYPITLTVMDSVGSTTSATVVLTLRANPAPTIGTFADTPVTRGGSAVNVTPSAAPSDANGNLGANPASVYPAVLPGGGTISVNAATGLVTISPTAGSTLGVTTVRVGVTDTCGATFYRSFNVSVISSTPALTAGPASAPTAESCTPANGAVDPNEVVIVSLPINNTFGGLRHHESRRDLADVRGRDAHRVAGAELRRHRGRRERHAALPVPGQRRLRHHHHRDARAPGRGDLLREPDLHDQPRRPDQRHVHAGELRHRHGAELAHRLDLRDRRRDHRQLGHFHDEPGQRAELGLGDPRGEHRRPPAQQPNHRVADRDGDRDQPPQLPAPLEL